LAYAAYEEDGVFGATDGPMTPQQMGDAVGKVLHFPTVLGAVVPTYNVPE